MFHTADQSLLCARPNCWAWSSNLRWAKESSMQKINIVQRESHTAWSIHMMERIILSSIWRKHWSNNFQADKMEEEQGIVEWAFAGE